MIKVDTDMYKLSPLRYAGRSRLALVLTYHAFYVVRKFRKRPMHGREGLGLWEEGGKVRGASAEGGRKLP